MSKIRYGDIVIYSYGNKPIIGIACSIEKDTDKYRVVPVSDANRTAKRYAEQLITLGDIEQAKLVLGKK